MTDWTPYTARASEWFESLRNAICAEFESIEREAGSAAAFEYTPWQRNTVEGEQVTLENPAEALKRAKKL